MGRAGSVKLAVDSPLSPPVDVFVKEFAPSTRLGEGPSPGPNQTGWRDDVALEALRLFGVTLIFRSEIREGRR